MKKLLFIINPASGTDDPILPVINNAFKDTDIDYDVLVTKKDQQFIELVSTTNIYDYDLLCVYGGDGTINYVAKEFIGQDIPILPLAGGSANMIARELNIPLELSEALEAIKDDKYSERLVDVAYCNDEFFLIAAVVGPMAKVNKTTSVDSKSKLGFWAYAYNFPKTADMSKEVKFRIKVDNKEYHVTGSGVIILNSQSQSPADMKLTQKAGLTNGKLSVVLIPTVNISVFTHGLKDLLVNRSLDNSLEMWKGKVVEISTTKKQSLLVDEKYIKTNLIKAHVIPSQIKMLKYKKE